MIHAGPLDWGPWTDLPLDPGTAVQLLELHGWFPGDGLCPLPLAWAM